MKAKLRRPGQGSMVLLVKDWVLGSALIAVLACLMFLGIWVVPDAIQISFVWIVAIFVTLIAAYIAVLGVLEACRLWQAQQKKHHDSGPA